MNNPTTIRLTQFSHGAGCGCKIAPGVLDKILRPSRNQNYPNLLVGYEQRDDAAVYLLDGDRCIISTTDFFMPIVDDPYDFGRIAAVNAISDVYAMGGEPIMALGILGWPIDKIDPYWAGIVLEGAKYICAEAGIPLAGGHSIDSPEPIFGLAVNGLIDRKKIKTNGAAQIGDLLYLTKPLGVGILTTAEKKSILKEEHRALAQNSMLKLNRVGSVLAEFVEVHAMTDVTGFGLAGHLLEICEASKVSARIDYVKLPLLTPDLNEYLLHQSIPGGTNRNWKSYGTKVKLKDDAYKWIVADPQTSGGLMVVVQPDGRRKVEETLSHHGLYAEPIGIIEPITNTDQEVEHRVYVE